jgi:hypothetical protein
VDGSTPQPVQKMDLDGLLHLVAKQQRLAREVRSCYEAGSPQATLEASTRGW